MASIAYQRAMPAAQVRFRMGYIALMRPALDRISATLARLANPDGTIPPAHSGMVRTAAAAALRQIFAPSGQPVIAEDGATRSPYARLLLGECARVTFETVSAHTDYMDAALPEDIKLWLARHTLSEMEKGISEQDGTSEWGGLGGLTDQQIDDLRIFRPNPLANYERMHTWVDPNGYRLSDRIWRTDQVTRGQLDTLLAGEIANGTSALRIARMVEQYLLPGRAKIRTKKDYTLDGTDASYDAMRLGRTEIAHAANQAAWLSGYLNAYVGGIDVVRSAYGDPTCPICPLHATIDLNGSRVRDPYPPTSAPIPPYHPHDMCNVQSVVRDDAGVVTQRLRAMVEDARAQHLEVLTPFQRDALITRMLGTAIWDILRQILPIQPALF